MNNDTNLIHEFYYIVGHKDFHSHYKLAVNKETEKMLYGNALNNEGDVYGSFAIKKSNLNKVTEIIDKKYGLVLRIQLKENFDFDVCEEAKMRIFYHLVRIAENFKMYGKVK